MILFNATSRRACALSDDKLTTGSVGIPVEFTFSDDWTAAPARIAVFRGSGQTVDVLLTGDSCSVPPEVLTEPGSVLSIGVYGTDGAGTVVIPTVYAEAGQIRRGAEPSGIEPTPTTQPLIDQLLAAAQAARDAADEAERLAHSVRDAAEAGEFDGADGADGNGVWYVDVQYTRTIGAGVQAQLDHMVGRPGATPAVGDLCVVSDGRFGSIASLTVRVAVVPVLCDLSGKSAYELAVEHGYTGTEAEWLETLKGADAVVDPTLTNAGEAADAKATGDELHRHYLELTALSPEIRADTYAWNLRKNYNGSGSYVTADGFGITSNYIPVQPGARVQNTAQERDGNGKYTAMHINEFAGTTWLRRTILTSGKYLTIGADATSIRIAYGYASNQDVTITQELIDATFSVRIIQQPASGSGGGGITVDDALSGSSTNPVQNKVVKAALDGKLGTSGAGSDVTVAFTAAAQRTAIGTGEKLSTLFGKILKWLSDLGTAAFKNATNSIAQGSTDLVESGAVHTELAKKYEKPQGGIPATDLAETYLTQHQDISGKADKVTEVTVDTDGDVTQALDAGKIYHFTGALTALTLTLNAAEAGKQAQYHLDFVSGATAPTVTIPATVNMPDGWTVEANTRYEIDILDGYGVAQSWEVTA